MISCTIKLHPTARQARRLDRWLWHLTGVWNWTVRKIELDAVDRRYYTEYDVKALLNGHSRKVGIPAAVIQDAATGAHHAWKSFFTGLRRRPRLKGRRNKLNWIVFRDVSSLKVRGRRIYFSARFGSFRFHKQDIPEGRVKRIRIVRRTSGWYGVLTIDAEPQHLQAGHGEVGIDPGFASLLTLSSGEKIDRPDELKRTARRLGQAQRGRRRHLTARLNERVGRQRKDRNHKLSRRLVLENRLIAWSKDYHAVIARRFGKSVQSSGHAQLRQMLAYKCRTGGAQFIEVASRNSTRRCSACQALKGPTGWAGLKVRVWECSACGARHERDVNAAVNTLRLGQGICHKSGREAASGIVI